MTDDVNEWRIWVDVVASDLGITCPPGRAGSPGVATRKIDALRAEIERLTAQVDDINGRLGDVADLARAEAGRAFTAGAEIERLRAIIDGAIIISRADIQAVKADLAHRFPLALDVKEDALT